MNSKAKQYAEKLIQCALVHPKPAFETTRFIREVYGDSSSYAPDSSDVNYMKMYRLLCALEEEGTVQSLNTKNNGRVWWLVERIAPVISPDTIAALWSSTDSLHRRFGKFPPVAAETMRVFQEEVREFQEEVPFHEAFQTDNDAVCQEAADVLVTVFATLSALGISREQFEAGANAVIAKNNAKTHDTHEVDAHTGKIKRRKAGDA